MKYEAPVSAATWLWDDPLLQSNGGPIFPPEQELDTENP